LDADPDPDPTVRFDVDPDPDLNSPNRVIYFSVFLAKLPERQVNALRN
jgi:hypothetical protein